MDPQDNYDKMRLSHLDLESSSSCRLTTSSSETPPSSSRAYSPFNMGSDSYSPRNPFPLSRNSLKSQPQQINKTAAMRRTSLPAISVQRPVSSQVRQKSF